MRKRLQKKLYKGPFERFGFDIIGEFHSDADKETIMWQLYDFLAQYGMDGALSYHPAKEDFDWYIDVGTRNMKPIQQKQIVLDWLKKRDDLVSFKANEIHDIDDKPYPTTWQRIFQWHFALL